MMWNTDAGVANGGAAGAVAGTKRRADESIGDSERFAKRFNLLSLGRGTCDKTRDSGGCV